MPCLQTSFSCLISFCLFYFQSLKQFFPRQWVSLYFPLLGLKLGFHILSSLKSQYVCRHFSFTPKRDNLITKKWPWIWGLNSDFLRQTLIECCARHHIMINFEEKVRHLWCCWVGLLKTGGQFKSYLHAFILWPLWGSSQLLITLISKKQNTDYKIVHVSLTQLQ